MYVLALSDYKQLAAAAGYKPAPQLGRQIAVCRSPASFKFLVKIQKLKHFAYTL